MLGASQLHNEEEKIRAIAQRITENIRPIFKKKLAHESNLILQCLKNHFIFYNLSAAQLQNVKENMFYAVVDPGINIFQKDDAGSCFFIIEKGSVDISVDGQVKKELKPLEGFGELALLYQHKRTSTVRTQSQCCFWVIDKISFMQAVQQVVTREYEENRKYLENLKFFPYLPSQTKDLISASLVTLKYNKNQVIVEEGDPGSAFYIIKQGVASLFKGTVQQRKMYRGQCFGQMSLYYNTMRRMTVKAEDDVKCLVLGRETLSKILGDSFHSTMFKNFIRYSFQRNRTLSKLPKNLQQKIMENMKITYYKPNDTVFKKGSIIQNLIVIFQGRLKKFKNPVVLASAGQTWGQEFLDRNRDVRIDDDIITDIDMVATEINFQDINRVLGGSLQQVLQNVSRSSSVVEAVAPNRAQLERVSLNDYNYLGEIAKIHYGSMHLIQKTHEPFQGKYVCKIIDKKILKENSLEAFLSNELQVLPLLHHPFICQYYKTFEQLGCFVNIFEFVQGMQLYDVIRDIGLLSSRDCQFYISSMVLMLEYLQHKQVVLRDMKPQNFVVDTRGYLKFVSFGASKWIGKTHKTSTIIGTPHYMAPEMVEGRQYNELVDLWAVGVMLYQFINGYLPFGAQTDSAFQIYEQILKADISFPKSLKDKRAKKLIEQMLSLNPEARHGGSYTNLKNNSWFENIDWDDLYAKNQKKVRPVYIPEKLFLKQSEVHQMRQKNKDKTLSAFIKDF